MYAFVSRLTYNKNNQDYKQLGDRALAIWHFKDHYYVTTTIINGGANVLENWKNIFHPPDHEGVWSYIYFSHGKAAGRSVSFTKFGLDANTIRTQFDTTHGPVNYLQFLVGGASVGYKGFTGLITSIVLRVNDGAFIDTME